MDRKPRSLSSIFPSLAASLWSTLMLWLWTSSPSTLSEVLNSPHCQAADASRSPFPAPNLPFLHAGYTVNFINIPI